jgi:hypothetical protein
MKSCLFSTDAANHGLYDLLTLIIICGEKNYEVPRYVILSIFLFICLLRSK